MRIGFLYLTMSFFLRLLVPKNFSKGIVGFWNLQITSLLILSIKIVWCPRGESNPHSCNRIGF